MKATINIAFIVMLLASFGSAADGIVVTGIEVKGSLINTASKANEYNERYARCSEWQEDADSYRKEFLSDQLKSVKSRLISIGLYDIKLKGYIADAFNSGGRKGAVNHNMNCDEEFENASRYFEMMIGYMDISLTQYRRSAPVMIKRLKSLASKCAKSVKLGETTFTQEGHFSRTSPVCKQFDTEQTILSDFISSDEFKSWPKLLGVNFLDTLIEGIGIVTDAKSNT
ncbi:hypothetical protein RI844_04955 [Thalassotalea fonticola]|uniref:Uncharacterized protein n=1 Tax=Thalassotalea fonticola TaxID=3065649 RepID=A0ABZ0GRZ7_9GAMM|nr:hypothetical protein RI844_04955 [Colwelliaceae bacterium S1-1]